MHLSITRPICQMSLSLSVGSVSSVDEMPFVFLSLARCLISMPRAGCEGGPRRSVANLVAGLISGYGPPNCVIIS